jgi:drug/metabolite transporter (DMT)-like permease
MNRGPLLMIMATLVLTCMSGAVKVARAELDTLDIVVWRSVIAIPLAWWWARGAALRIEKKGLLGIRIGLGFVAMLCFFTALKELPLADTNMITKLQPVLIALGAPLFLGRKERADPKLWGLLIVGLVGTSILVAPGVMTGSVWGLWALASSIFSAGAHIALRGLKGERSTAVVFWLQVAVFSLALALSLIIKGGITVPPAHIWPALIGVGVFATGGQLLMTKAYAIDKASRVAAVRFVGPVWGVAGDVLFFGGWPELHVWIGGVIVVSAGLYVTVQKSD